MSQCQENFWTEEGQTLIHRTLLATAGGPTKRRLNIISQLNMDNTQRIMKTDWLWIHLTSLWPLAKWSCQMINTCKSYGRIFNISYWQNMCVKNIRKLISNIVLYSIHAEKFYPTFSKCIWYTENPFGISLNKHASLLLGL